ncbi:hypothetical protein [Streptomyces thermoalcalitolerans]|uniref:Uncharacterized protein n=1 Tax=Streptomyces thermoalcalitolerans TaxID=65605 RepID=A0ABP3YU03_9ACTN
MRLSDVFTEDEVDLSALEAPENPSAPAARRPLERAAEDLLISRPDLGNGHATMILAGEPIPRHLAGFERRPLNAPSARRRSPQRRGKSRQDGDLGMGA